ncbi:MAG: AAA family ATPase [Cytophagaceae bacterium]|nr:AAA family ATPase [Cytophagaceae bacterium]
MSEKQTFLESIEKFIIQLALHKQLAIDSEVNEHAIYLHNRAIDQLDKLKNKVLHSELKPNYINQFQNDVNQLANYFQYRGADSIDLSDLHIKDQVKNNIEVYSDNVERQLNQLEFNFGFFNKLGFFENNIVAIGANGSGKSTLSNELKKYLPKSGVVIAAQKILVIPTFSGISNVNSTNEKLQNNQNLDKTLRTTYSTESNGNAYGILVQVGGEFQILLDNLLAERSAIINIFCHDLKNGGTNITVPDTKLDKALLIWNSLIQHRTLECTDGINLTLKAIDKSVYAAHQMSDGEKVMLYHIAQVLQAPKNGFIIVDEPEMYLHKTILKKLWDILEKERQDCIFVYLSHDLDFATSRTTAKKVWIRSFSYPSTWEIENIPENELPENLLLELLGSRKNILFCEGDKGSTDEKLYNLLFPEYTVTPVGSCFSVMNYTKAFNKISNIIVRAFGIIDSDHHDLKRLESLKSDSIFSFSMAEIENVFLDEEFLKLIASKILVDESLVDAIKRDVLEALSKEIELQISNYVSTKINYYFKDSHVSKGNSLAEVEKNHKRFSDEIKIQEWFAQRRTTIEKIIEEKNYVKALSIYNNKGLRKIVNYHFKISDYPDRAIRLIQFDNSCHTILLNHFPQELK